MPKLPEYEERSALLEQEDALEEKASIREVTSIIRHSLKESVKELINLTRSGDESIRLNAVKHHLKLAGLEVEKSEVNNKGAMSLTISPEQAARVIEAANK